MQALGTTWQGFGTAVWQFRGQVGRQVALGVRLEALQCQPHGAKRGQVALGVRVEALQRQPHGAKWRPSGVKLRLEGGLEGSLSLLIRSTRSRSEASGSNIRVDIDIHIYK